MHTEMNILGSKIHCDFSNQHCACLEVETLNDDFVLCLGATEKKL